MRLCPLKTALALALGVAGSAKAATAVWTGAAVPNTNWSTALNWAGNIPPASGDDLVFPGTAQGKRNYNDLAAAVAFNSLQFSNGATSYFIRSASELRLGSGITVTNATFGPMVAAPVRLLADQTFQASGGFSGLGSITLDGHVLTFDTPDLTDGIAVGGIVDFGVSVPGIISGTGTVRKRGSGLLALHQPNTYAGLTVVEAGTLELGFFGTLGAAEPTVISNGATLYVPGSRTVNEPLRLSGTLAFDSGTNSLWTGSITLEAANATFDIAPGQGPFGNSVDNVLRVSGLISGNGGLVKTNLGTLLLDADNTYSGESRLLAGTLVINNSHLTGAVTLGSNTTFAARGQLGSLTSLGATWGAGGLTAAGLLRINGNLSLDAATRFIVDINGPGAGTDFDQVRVTGAVNLGSAQLVLQTRVTPALGSAFVIIKKDSPRAVTGTFAGLPQGAMFTRGAFVWQIDYFGIDGNDVVLRVISQSTPGVVWDGGGADTNWLTPENWLSEATPSPGSDLIFSNEAAQRTNFNNFPPGTSFNGLRFTGTSQPDSFAFNLSGNAVAIDSAITADTNAGTSTLNIEPSLASGATIRADSPASLRFNGAVTQIDSDFVLDGTGSLTFNAPIHGAGGLVSSSGFARLRTNNIFSGPIRVAAGGLRIDTEGAFGSTSNAVTVESNGILQLEGAMNLANSLELSGALQAFRTSTWSGPISALGNQAGIVTGFGGPLTIAAPISGSGELAISSSSGFDLVEFKATNTYSGLTRLRSGVLLVNGSHAGGSLHLGTNLPSNPTTLGGTGTVGSVFAGGTIAPGLTTSPGLLTVVGGLTLSNSAVLDLQINGVNAGVGYDQVRVSGEVRLDSPALQIAFGSFTPASDTVFTLIRNDSAAPVVGSFAGLPESAFLTNGTVIGRITYRGGDGNDVVLRVGTNPPSVLPNGPCAPLPTGAVAWWRGEESVNDSVGTNHGVLADGATFASGAVGQAFAFDGIKAAMPTQVGAAAAISNNFTMELWAYPTAERGETTESTDSTAGLGSGQRFAVFPRFGGDFGSGPRAGAGISIGTNGISVFEHAFFYVPSLLVYTGAFSGWTHVAVVYNNNQPLLYMNGALVHTGLQSTKVVHPGSALGGAAGASAAYGFYAGLVDEYSIYDRALSDQEIHTIYAAGSAGKCQAVCVPRPSDLVSWWRAETNANDFAGVNNGTFEGPASFTNGIAGQGFLFNGASGGVNLGNVPAFDFTPDSSFSIEAWFDSFGPSGVRNDGQAIVSLNYHCSPTLQSLTMANANPAYGVVNFSVRDANGVMGFVSSPPVSSNAFHFAVGVREVVGTNKTLRLYLDGALVGTTNDPTTAALAIDTPDWIGRRNSCGTDNVFHGIIDEVSVYGRALAASEVRDLYAAGAAGKCLNSIAASQLFGIVRDTVTGSGLSGVTISVTGSVSTNVTTSANGGFTLQVPSTGVCTLLPTQPGYSFEPASLSITNPPAVVSDIQFAGSALQTVTVLLRDSNDSPIPAGLVTLENRVAGQITTVRDGTSDTLQIAQAAPPLQGFTDAQGTFIFTNLLPSLSYRVSATKADYDFRPPSKTLPLLLNSQTVSFLGTSKSPRTLSGHLTFQDGSPAPNIPVALTMPAAGNSSVMLLPFIQLTDRDGRYAYTGLAAVASCTVTPSAIVDILFSPVSRTVSLANADATADFLVMPKPVRIQGRITPGFVGPLAADIPVVVAFSDAGQGTNVGRASAVVKAVSRLGNYTSPPLAQGRSYFVRPRAPGVQFTPAEIQVGSLVESVANVDFTFRPVVNLTGRVTNSSGFGLSAVEVKIVGGVKATQRVSADGSFAFHDLPAGQNYTLSASHTNFIFNPPSVQLPNLSLSRTQDFAGELALPVSGRIALLRNDQIVVMNADSSLPVTLPKVFADSQYTRAVLSPDGTKVAYVPFNAWGAALYPVVIQDVDGSNVRFLTGTNDIAVDAAWSPDGTRVAAVLSASTTRPHGIYLLDLAGTGAFRLNQSSGREYHLSWSPDGRSIIFNVHVEGFAFTGIQVTLTNANSRNEDQGSGAGPSWSPNGGGMYIASEPGYLSDFVEWGQYIPGAPGTQNFPLRGSAPAWSPDAAFLAIEDGLQVSVVTTNDTFRTPLGDGTRPDWSRAPKRTTPTGQNVTVSSGVAAVTFQDVTTPGTTTVLPAPPPASHNLPPGYALITGGPTLMNFEVNTTAGHSGPITLCFTLTNITDAATFGSLRILHNENGRLADRTLLAPDLQAPNFAAKTICARVASLSPFSVAQLVDPALPLIAGVVVDADDNPVSDVTITRSGEGGFPVRTDARGFFILPNLSGGETYAVVASDSQYDFDPPAALVENLTGTNLLAFRAATKAGPSLNIVMDPLVPGQLTLQWPITSSSYTLEFTVSLMSPVWKKLPVKPFLEQGNWVLSLQVENAPLFFRLRQ